jgi:hypothetical protein
LRSIKVSLTGTCNRSCCLHADDRQYRSLQERLSEALGKPVEVTVKGSFGFWKSSCPPTRDCYYYERRSHAIWMSYASTPITTTADVVSWEGPISEDIRGRAGCASCWRAGEDSDHEQLRWRPSSPPLSREAMHDETVATNARSQKGEPEA